MYTSAGFDFGTSNCAVGVMKGQQAQLLELPQHGNFVSSTLYAPMAEVIPGWLFRQLQQAGIEAPYLAARKNLLSASLHALNEAKLDGYEDKLDFGQGALSKYLVDPADCYYVKSPKSFLGGSGISERQKQMFEDITASMMWHVRAQVAESGQGWLKKVVIGKPVNFQGVNSERSNQQALGVLTRAAKFAGFEQVEFLYEPIAAGLRYQQQLEQAQRVLVVDIGGGTSDISMLAMPKGSEGAEQHESWVLGYSGERIGGNDLDIELNCKGLMPSLGARLTDPKGREIPIKPFSDAAAVNNIGAQTRFYGLDTRKMLQELQKQPGLESLSRILHLQKQLMSFQLNGCAERAKIALSSADSTRVDLDFIEAELAVEVAKSEFTEAAQGFLKRLAKLIDEVLKQAECEPEAVFLTGGSANAPFIREFLNARYQWPLVAGDNFGSVASGLTLWSQQVFEG